MRITAPKTIRVQLQNVPALNVEWGPEDWIEIVPLGWFSSLELEQIPTAEPDKTVEWHLQRLKDGVIHGADGTAYHLPADWDQLPWFARWHIYNDILTECWRGSEFKPPPTEEALKNASAPSKPSS